MVTPEILECIDNLKLEFYEYEKMESIKTDEIEFEKYDSSNSIMEIDEENNYEIYIKTDELK